jgi:NAD(P)H-nitrite reductase large subunit
VAVNIEEIKARRRVVCICRAIPMGKILDAIRGKGCKTVEDVNRVTGCGKGDCGGQRCRPVIKEVLDRETESV